MCSLMPYLGGSGSSSSAFSYFMGRGVTILCICVVLVCAFLFFLFPVLFRTTSMAILQSGLESLVEAC